MEFTYDGYKGLLEKLKKHGYQTADYHNWSNYGRCVILRHDIDNDIEKAVRLASFEQAEGVASTYFVLLTCNFYNVFSKNTRIGLEKIRNLGHQIGLHFDEMQYRDIAGNMDGIREKIRWEARILGEAAGCEIRSVSMHRPSKAILDSGGELKIPGIANSYGQMYFKEFKYLSDSRRRWREPVEEIIESERYERLHILTHGFWYHERELTIGETVGNFVNRASRDRYLCYKENFTNLEEVMEYDNSWGNPESLG